MKNKFLFFIVVCLMSYFNGIAQQKSQDLEVKKLKASEKELWYVDKSPPVFKGKIDTVEIKPEKYNGREPIANPERVNEIFNFLQYLLIIIFVIAILFLIINSKFDLSFGNNKNEKIIDIISDKSKIENIEDLDNVDFKSQIEKAEKSNNYNLAIRIYYLWLLQKLSHNLLISYHFNKTNKQYCDEMRNHKNAKEFENCTKLYNYVWFGEFKIEDDLYQKLSVEFKSLIGKFI